MTRRRTRIARRLATRLDDIGVSSLEIVVIAVGLFVLATLMVAGITTAVQSRLNGLG